MVLFLRKLYLYFTKDPEGVHYFPGVGVQLIPGGGVQMLMSIETHITCYFPGGSGPTIPLRVRTWAMSSYNGTIFITVPLLTIIVRH